MFYSRIVFFEQIFKTTLNIVQTSDVSFLQVHCKAAFYCFFDVSALIFFYLSSLNVYDISSMNFFCLCSQVFCYHALKFSEVSSIKVYLCSKDFFYFCQRFLISLFNSKRLRYLLFATVTAGAGPGR